MDLANEVITCLLCGSFQLEKRFGPYGKLQTVNWPIVHHKITLPYNIRGYIHEYWNCSNGPFALHDIIMPLPVLPESLYNPFSYSDVLTPLTESTKIIGLIMVVIFQYAVRKSYENSHVSVCV
jgi:hypothetical protein